MLRSLAVVIGLVIATPALACGGGDCDKSHCKMKSTEEVSTAMAEVDAATGDKLALEVSGMKCGSCSDKVLAALKAIEGVNAAAVSHATGEAKIAYDATKVDAEKLIAAIKGVGFDAKVPEAA